MTVVTKLGVISKDQWDNIKVISAEVESGKYNTFEYPEGTDYKPDSGIALRIGVIDYYMRAVGKIMKVGYGDTTVNQSATPPTNPVILVPQLPVENAYQVLQHCVFLLIPSGKYPFLYSPDSDGYAIMQGYEDE